VADRYLSTEEMQAVWAMTDAFISIPPYDGISEGILEGMYAGGIPVVSDIASNRAFLEEEANAIFVPGSSIQDLLTTLEQVVDTLPDLKATMVPTNKAWVENHASVEKTARQVADLVRGLSSRFTVHSS
jgi:glycosyltransferase involved in cell wall biosynthesis